MTSIDVGKLQSVEADPLYAAAKSIRIQPAWIDKAWDGVDTVPEPQYMDAGERGALERLPPDAFKRGYTLDRLSLGLGVESQFSMPEEAQTVLRQYREAKSAGWADDIRVRQLTYERGRMTPEGTPDLVNEVVRGTARAFESVGNGLLTLGELALIEAPRVAFNMMGAGRTTEQGVGDTLVEAGNSVLGIEGAARPEPGVYLETLARKVAGSEQPIAELYKDVQKAEGARKAGRGAVAGTAEFAGEMLGGAGPLFIGKLAGALGAAEKTLVSKLATTPLVKKVVEAGVKAAPRLFPKAVGAARLAASPGLRIGASAGLETEGSGSERLGAFLFGAATAPVAVAISHGASRLASGALRGSPRFNAAFADWLEAKGGGLASRAPAGALGEFIEAGMPGVPGSVVFRAAAESAKAFAEGLGFSAMDLGWWHDVYKSMANGDAAATARMVEKVYGNALGLAILSRGGNARWYEQFEAEAAAAALKASRMAREARWAKRPEQRMPEGNEPQTGVEPFREPPPDTAGPTPRPSPRGPAPTGEVVRQAPGERDVAMAQARVKLHGIGEPITDVERMHYDGEKPPIIVRWTPEFGYQKRNALDPQETWVRMRSNDVEMLRLAAPPSGPIPEQLAVADLVAKELAERTDIAPETAALGAETLQVLSTVPKAEDMAVQAAVEVAQMIPPAQWRPEQFDAFNQLILRGTTPGGQMITGQAFVEGAKAVAPTEPVAAQSGPAEDPRPAVDIRALEEAQGAAIRDLRLLGPEPRKPSSEKKFFGAKGRAGAAPEHVALFDAETKAYSSWRRRYSKLKKIEVEASNKLWFARQKAESQSQPDVLPTDLPDAAKTVTDEIVGPEAGAVDPRVTAAAILTAATYATAGPIGLGISGMALLERTLYQHWAQPIAERLQYQGDAELSKPVRQMFAKIRQETAEFSARLEPLVQKVREMASESPFSKVSRAHQEAARFAQHVNWTNLDTPRSSVRVLLPGPEGAPPPSQTTVTYNSKSKRAYGVDNHLLYQDAWTKDWTGLDPKVKELFEAVHAAIVESGKMGHEVGIEALDKKTGKTYVTKYNPERYILPRIITSDFHDILQKPGSELWNIVRDGIMDLNGVTLQEADMSMKLLQQTVGFRRSAMESTRIIRRMMSYIRTEDGREIQILETRPFEYVNRLQNATSQRLANIKVKGQEALTDEHHKDSPPGVPLSPRATFEQVRERKAMEAYVSGSKDKDKALRALMATERAHAGLPTEPPGTFMADMVPAPGSDWHAFMRHVMWPLRAAWMTVKLPFTFVQAGVEPYGTPSTYLGSWRVAKADALTKWQVVRSWPALMRDARRFSEMGGVVDMPTVRWGGFNSMRLSKAHRGQDLARMLMRFGNAPNKWANWLNDITIARAGEAMIADLRAEVQKPVTQQSAARLNEVRLTLQELDYTKEQVDEFMSGMISPRMEIEFLRRLRQDTMGVRGPEKQGFLQSLRAFRFAFPFQSYISNNTRVWGRMFDSFRKAFTDQSMPKAERKERVKRMFAHLKNKHISLAMTMLALLFVQNGTDLMSAFEGSTPWQTTKNFYKRLLSFAAFAEIAGPVIGPVAHDMISNRTEDYAQSPVKEIVGSVAEATWMGGLLTDLVQVLAGTGKYESFDGAWDRLVTFAIGQAPPMKYAKQWTDDMELRNFINRRYEMFPPDFKGSGNLTAFQGQMKKFQTLLREEYADFSIPTHDELRSLLRDAVMTPPEDPIALAEWEKMPTSAKREAGWQHVVDSLRSRKVLRGLKEEHLRQLRTEIGERGMRRLRDLDRETARWADWAETQK